jgi:predicted nucleic acid-binding protein
MMLLDTCIWLELLLLQQRADRVRRLLAETSLEDLHMTDFSLHSIGVILTRQERLAVLSRFLDDVCGDAGVQMVRLMPSELRFLPAISHRFGLDFDDAYQYAAATFRNLPFLSFDRHFDSTDLKRREP